MKRLGLIFTLLLALAVPGFSQGVTVTASAIRGSTSAPTGQCSPSGASSVAARHYNGTDYRCVSGTWTAIGATGAITPLSITITGTGGNGFVSLLEQSSAPSQPTNALRLYANASNVFVWKDESNVVRTVAPLESPSFTTPTLGAALATSVNKITLTAPATGATLTLIDGKVFTVSNTLTLAGTDGSTLNVGTGGTLGTGAYATIANYAPLASPTFTGTVVIPTPFTLGATSVTSTGTQINYLAAATGTTGTASANVVFSDGPTLVAPLLGTPASGVLTNATGYLLNNLANPGGTTALTMGANPITFTWNSTTGANDLVVYTTGSADNGSGYVMKIANPGSNSKRLLNIVGRGTTTALDIDDVGKVGIGGAASSANLTLASSTTAINALNINSASGATVPLVINTHTSNQTAAVAGSHTYRARSSGTAASGFGQRVEYGLESSTTNDQPATYEDVWWNVATHASRGAVYALSTASNAVINKRFVLAPRKAVTDGAASSLFEVAVASGSSVGGTVEATIYADDGTEFQSRSVVVTYQAVNKAGSITSSATIVSETAAVSSGTLTATWAATAGASKITIQVTPDSSLTATSFYVVYTVKNNSEQEVTIL